jgi:hypothetical protein
MKNSYDVLVEKRKVRGHLEDLGVDYIRMDLRDIMWEEVEWLHLAQDRDHWLALVKAVMNFRVL